MVGRGVCVCLLVLLDGMWGQGGGDKPDALPWAVGNCLPELTPRPSIALMGDFPFGE